MSFPLLGKRNEILGDFDINCIPKGFIDTNGDRKWLFQLKEQDVIINNQMIKDLFDEKKVDLITTIFCSSTLYKSSFSGLDKIIVAPNEIGGKVLITTTINSLSDFEIDLSSNSEVVPFFQSRMKLGLGQQLSVPVRKSFNIPVLDSGSSGSIIKFKYEDIENVKFDFGLTDENASRVLISYPNKEFVSDLKLHLKMRKHFSELSTSLFFESVYVKMFSLIAEEYQKHLNHGGQDHDFYDNIKPWMQELLNKYDLLDWDFNSLGDFQEAFNIINQVSSGKLVIADSLNQLNTISDSNE